MQNLIVFCRHCFTWVETHSDLCPDCGVEVCLDQPDPDLETLSEILGKPLAVLGPLRIERYPLPDYGFIVGTTEGLLFLPRLHRRVNGAWEGVTSQRLPNWWPFRGDITSPRFLNWLRRPFGIAVHDEQKAEAVAEQETDSLATRLMDSPGAFFLEHRFIKDVTQRRRIVRVVRSPLRSVTFTDETEEGSLCGSLNALVAQAMREKLRPAL